jgi:hypothetical protein
MERRNLNDTDVGQVWNLSVKEVVVTVYSSLEVHIFKLGESRWLAFTSLVYYFCTT